MASALFLMDQYVAARDILQDDLECPSCKSKTFSLVGNSQISRREEWQDGQIVHTDTGEEHVFEVEQIECLNCLTRSRIRPSAWQDTVLDNQKLRARIIELTGVDPFGAGKPN